METNSKKQFISYCMNILKQTEFVSYQPENLSKFESDLTEIKTPNWKWFLSSDQISIEETFIELVFNASLNGGYFQKTNNHINQWEINGSGSYALQCWIQDLHSQNLIPFKKNKNIKKDLISFLKDKPFSNQRLKICLYFQQENFIQKLKEIKNQILKENEVNFDILQKLINVCPTGFAEDPFKKKALLALHMFTGYLYSKNILIENKLPIPADYQIPRILSYHNVISINDTTKAILQKEILPGEHKIIQELRAAAVIGCYTLNQIYNIPEYLIDAKLFMSYRKQKDFNEKTIPKIQCDKMWF